MSLSEYKVYPDVDNLTDIAETFINFDAEQEDQFYLKPYGADFCSVWLVFNPEHCRYELPTNSKNTEV